VRLAEKLEKCQKLICKTVVMHYIVEKSLPSASANWNLTHQTDGYYNYYVSFHFYINDTFDFSTTVQILSFGLLSLGKPFDINLSWNEYRAGVFE